MTGYGTLGFVGHTVGQGQIGMEGDKVGAILLQAFQDRIFPIGYARYKLLPRERKYAIIEKSIWQLSVG